MRNIKINFIDSRKCKTQRWVCQANFVKKTKN